MLLWAAYILVDGVFVIVSAIRAAAGHERWGWLILEGIVDIIAGIAAFLVPGLTVLVLVTLLGAWAVVSGVLMVLAAIRLHAAHGRWLLALSGLISVVWGVLLYLAPIAGALLLTWWLGGYALAFGVVLLVLAFRLRGRHDRPVAPSQSVPRARLTGDRHRAHGAVQPLAEGWTASKPSPDELNMFLTRMVVGRQGSEHSNTNR